MQDTSPPKLLFKKRRSSVHDQQIPQKNDIAIDRASKINFKLKPSKVTKQEALTTRCSSSNYFNCDKGFIDLDPKRDLPIKKPMSAYVLFGNMRREDLAHKKLPVTEIVKIIA